ncbi:hypothetical protein [Phaeobacter sp. HF9A]|uniref:hypothetical protein n=1 Tax=Phaeobacter sp. HF9A TaxID=2721561 RepID=UPI00143163B8|nr:hypothetical protein [Phaeobacter sp. HF9A]NIZ12915.1 hypothetical protein [Phaeobacter sp. HF9A]
MGIQVATLRGETKSLAGGSSDLIDALAAARSIPALEMAQRIQSKRDEYRTVYIVTTAHRHQLLQQIETATDLQELQALDLDAGWPLA